ncbi:hypothetical protein KN10_0906 [Anoxybacillus flavithermus NBRC 109594]|uniref:Uncharacterized protein n=1 Tax=Anoxybacillus flavithermus NBRC 109594 TaxID=1315967 RepID=R4FCD7_9BACL|nr:hypothetical protein KN10_0906 [Anoxybacillus flavithermus NBRC 109594]
MATIFSFVGTLQTISSFVRCTGVDAVSKKDKNKKITFIFHPHFFIYDVKKVVVSFSFLRKT